MTKLRTRLGGGARSVIDNYAGVGDDSRGREQVHRQQARERGVQIQKKYPIGTRLVTSMGNGKVVGYTHAGLRIKNARNMILSISVEAIIRIL